jgi:tetratricopeptide (TPR) repeat protein
MMNIFRSNTLKIWGKAALFSVPLLAMQAVIPTVIGIEGGFTAGLVYAADKDKKKDERKTKRTQALGNKVYEKLSAAQVAAEEKNYPEAIKLLDKLLNSKKPLNGYEAANVYLVYAFIYYSQENYSKALENYNNVLKQPDIPEAMGTSTRFTVAQLYFVMERWQEGIKALEAWFRVAENPNASAYILMGQGYYQLKDYNHALQNVEKAISMYKEKGKTPKENWYGLQRFLYYEKENYKKVVTILEEMLVYYPKKQYWVQLSAMYAEIKREERQVQAMDTAYVQGMLEKEGELRNMAYLFLGAEVPYKAAIILDDGINNTKVIKSTSKNLELLANSWRQAQEVKKSIPEMRKAAKKAEKGELWARLGSIYLDNDNYEEAIKAVKAGLKKGEVKRPDTANLVLGMAYFNLKKYDSALKAFNKAGKDKRSATYAKQWKRFMAKELERQRSLEQT